MHDVLIKSGTVVDGTGRAGFTGDVAFRDGRITAVGKNLGSARRTIDTHGLLVTPAWVDVHTHYDGQVTWDPKMALSLWHGVGTDPPRESIPAGGRDLGLVWSVGAGISGVYRTQQTQLTTSGNWLFFAAGLMLSCDSFSGPPFTSEGGTKSGKRFGPAAELGCTAPAGFGFAGLAVRSEAALDSRQSRANSSGARSPNEL